MGSQQQSMVSSDTHAGCTCSKLATFTAVTHIAYRRAACATFYLPPCLPSPTVSPAACVDRELMISMTVIIAIGNVMAAAHCRICTKVKAEQCLDFCKTCKRRAYVIAKAIHTTDILIEGDTCSVAAISRLITIARASKDNTRQRCITAHARATDPAQGSGQVLLTTQSSQSEADHECRKIGRGPTDPTQQRASGDARAACPSRFFVLPNLASYPHCRWGFCSCYPKVLHFGIPLPPNEIFNC